MRDRIPDPIITHDRRGRRDVVLTPETSAAALEVIDGMRCNHSPGLLELFACKTPPNWAPRLIVPSKTQAAEGHRHIHMDSRQLHFCDAHQGEIKLDDMLGLPGIKGAIEKHAKQTRPVDFKCDFEAAHIVYVNIFTPEYKFFALVMAVKSREAAHETWGTPIANF